MYDQDKLIRDLRAHTDILEARLDEAEKRRVIAQGKADTYKLELQVLRKAREKGRRANRNLRDQITELQVLLSRMTNRRA